MAARRAGRVARRRLSRSADFDRVFREGRSHANRYLVVHVFPRAHAGADPDRAPHGGARLGISVGRKVGGAVERNRVKRLVGKAFGRIAGERPPAREVWIVARAGASELVRRRGEPGVEEELGALLAEAQLTDGAGR